ncbi:hypothetical protein Trydic_g9687 [Trypoxylus dichotomus]
MDSAYRHACCQSNVHIKRAKKVKKVTTHHAGVVTHFATLHSLLNHGVLFWALPIEACAIFLRQKKAVQLLCILGIYDTWNLVEFLPSANGIRNSDTKCRQTTMQKRLYTNCWAMSTTYDSLRWRYHINYFLDDLSNFVNSN